MPRIRIDAPAKLNLSLHIGDRRPDGYHAIESLFLALAFGDVLAVETAQGSPEITMDWQSGASNASIPEIPAEHNIISRAVALFSSRTGYDRGLKINVEKRIPLGGGLGGGSSDAAAALLALNLLAGGNNSGLLDIPALAEMGAALGSDVPFFVYCAADRPAAWVSGRGERVRPVILPDAVLGLSLLLVNPGFPSDTALAYRLFDKYRQKEPSLRQSDAAQLQSFAHSPDNWHFFNDFLPVFNAAGREETVIGGDYSVYRRIIADLRELGADFAGLSGSGSTCFGVFADRGIAGSARESLLKRFPYVIETLPLARRTIQYYN